MSDESRGDTKTALEAAAPQGSRLKRGLGKALKLIGLLFLLYLMVDNLNQLSLMKAMDSKLATNERLMVKAIEYQEGMHESEKLAWVMAEKMVTINDRMREANELAAETNDITLRIKQMNDSMLGVNAGVNDVVIANLRLADVMLWQNTSMKSYMERMNMAMGRMNGSAERQLDLTRQLYELTKQSNDGVPPLP